MADGIHRRGPADAELELRQAGESAVLVVLGDLDSAAVPHLTELLDRATAGSAATPGDIIVDLSGVRLMDCAALGVLVAAAGRLPDGRRLRVSGAGDHVLELMEIGGAAKLLGAYDPPVAPGWRQESAAWPGERLADRTEQLLRDLAGSPVGSPGRVRLRERAIATALPIAEQLARRYRNRGQSDDDLRQVAYLGLIKAVDGYDPALGYRFVSYAIPTVLGELRRYFRDQTWGVRVPRRTQEMRLRILGAVDELTQRLGRSPTVAQLAEFLDADEEQVIEAQVAGEHYRPASLFTPVAENGAALVDLVGQCDPGLDAVDHAYALSAVVRTLPQREQRIIAMRFYGNYSQSQIAQQLGISQMHVSRLLSRTLARLRQALLAEG